MSRQGYDLVLSPDRRAVTAYSTVHRERTWEQVKSGVRSRFRRQPSPNRPAMGPTIALPDFGTSFDPATIYLTKSAMTSFARVGGRTQATDAEIETALRGALRELPAERATQRDDGVFEIASGGDIWVISPDCRSLIVVVAGRSVPNCSTPSASDSPTPSR